MSVKEWIRYQTEVWNEDHEKLVAEITAKLIWYRPKIRRKILAKVEEALKHIKREKLTK